MCYGNVLSSNIQYLWPFAYFTINYTNTTFLLKKLNQNVAFSKLMKTLELNNTVLSDLIIQPVQHIMRYPLLIKQLLDSTPK